MAILAAHSLGRATPLGAALYGEVAGNLPEVIGRLSVRDSRGVDSEPLVGFLTGGLAVRWGRCSLGFLLTAFSDLFEGQTSSREYGTLTLSVTL